MLFSNSLMNQQIIPPLTETLGTSDLCHSPEFTSHNLHIGPLERMIHESTLNLKWAF